MIKIVTILTMLFLPYSSNAQSAYVKKAIYDAASAARIPYKLLEGVCWKESRLNPKAFNYSDGGGDNHAVGMCQVLISTASSKSLGKYRIVDNRCRQDFRSTKSKRKWKHCRLFGPRANAFIAAQILKQNIRRYNGDFTKAIAAYNTGTIKVCRDGWLYYKKKRYKKCKIGDFANQYYIDGIIGYLVGKYGNRNATIVSVIYGK